MKPEFPSAPAPPPSTLPPPPHFSLLIKPASADCNLKCEYCFYLGKCVLYPETKRHRMSEAVLERMIRSYLATAQPAYNFGWQGGEPTLMGLDFFRRVTDLQQKHGQPGTSVANGVQTNATLIDDAMAEHFARFNFLLGCSLDGPEEVHDLYRHTIAGAPSHRDVLRGIGVLRKHKVEFNILVLVSQSNVRRAREVYRYLVGEGFLYHQYIPCVEYDAAGNRLPFAIGGEAWGAFLCDLFEEWRARDTYRVSIRHFDSLLAKLVDGAVSVCTLGRNCCQYFVVEYNGDIYPCDFFVEPHLRIGNVADTSWDAALRADIYRRFGELKSDWNERCNACRHLDLCAGDCLKHRLYANRPPSAPSALCEGWSMFLERTRPGFEQLAADIRQKRIAEQNRFAAALPPPARGAIGRNDPCSCGSGRKFKHCCGKC